MKFAIYKNGERYWAASTTQRTVPLATFSSASEGFSWLRSTPQSTLTALAKARRVQPAWHHSRRGGPAGMDPAEYAYVGDATLSFARSVQPHERRGIAAAMFQSEIDLGLIFPDFAFRGRVSVNVRRFKCDGVYWHDADEIGLKRQCIRGCLAHEIGHSIQERMLPHCEEILAMPFALRCRRDYYWGDWRECFARSFEYVVYRRLAELGVRNDFLVTLPDYQSTALDPDVRALRPWPTDLEYARLLELWSGVL